jgi:hypothetical protein
LTRLLEFRDETRRIAGGVVYGDDVRRRLVRRRLRDRRRHTKQSKNNRSTTRTISSSRATTRRVSPSTGPPPAATLCASPRSFDSARRYESGACGAARPPRTSPRAPAPPRRLPF